MEAGQRCARVYERGQGAHGKLQADIVALPPSTALLALLSRPLRPIRGSLVRVFQFRPLFTVPPSNVAVASTSNDSTSVAPAQVVPAAAAAAVAAESPVATESLTAAVAPTVASKSVTAACTSKNVPRDIGLTEYSDDSDGVDTDSIDSFQSSVELMEEDLPLGCGRLQIDLDEDNSISSFASGVPVVDSEEMSSSPPSTMNLFPNTSVSQVQAIPESSLENTRTSPDVLFQFLQTVLTLSKCSVKSNGPLFQGALVRVLVAMSKSLSPFTPALSLSFVLYFIFSMLAIFSLPFMGWRFVWSSLVLFNYYFFINR